MKKHLLFNQSFGTEGSPNQTGETLTRENRIGLMSYLRRTLMLLIAVLVMSVGEMWGTDVCGTMSTANVGAMTRNGYEFASNFVIYACNSNYDTIAGHTNFGTNIQLSNDSKDTGAALSSQQRMVLSFPVNITGITITGFNNNSRYISKVFHNSVLTANSKERSAHTWVEYSSSTDFSVTASQNASTKVWTMTISFTEAVSAGTKIGVYLSGGLNTYGICYTPASSGYTLTADATVVNPNSTGGTGGITATITNSPVTGISSGTTTSTSSNTFTVAKATPVTVTAPATVDGSEEECDYCTYRFDSWENIPASVTADVSNIHAKYITTYDLAYNLDGGDWADAYSAPEYYVYGTGVTLPVAANVEKEGYNFDGWTHDYDDSDIEEVDDEAWGGVSVTAHWSLACSDLNAPTGLECVDQSYNTLSFSWDAVANASSYDVKLWTNSLCTGDPVKSANTTNTTCRFRDLSSSTTYYCKVQTKGDGSTYCTSGGTTATAASGTTLSGTRKFKSGERIYFKDDDVISGVCMKYSGDKLWAVFNGTSDWIEAQKESGTWDEEGAIYYFDVPGENQEYDFVIFTRNGWGIQTGNESTDIGKNMFVLTSYDGNKTVSGTWSKYASGAALIGDFNDWDPDQGKFVDGRVILDLEAETDYEFKVLVGDGTDDNNYWACDLCSYITNTTLPDWALLYKAQSNNFGLTTGEAGEYCFHWNNSTHYLGVYYPQARLAKNKYIYFDASNLASDGWNVAAFSVKFVFKPYDNSSYEKYSVNSSYSTNVLEDHIYYAVVPDDDYLGFVRVDRWATDFSGTRWNYADDAVAHERTSSKQNCMITKDADKGNWDGLDQEWKIYCPPTTSETFTDNSTSVIAGTSGDGTSGSPYLVPTTGTINVQASASKAVNDGNMTINYDFKVDDSSAQPGEGNTYSKGSLSNNTTYKMSVDAYTVYNLDDSKHSTKHTPTELYYKALNVYTISYNKGSNGTGDNTTAEKIYGISKTLLGVTFTRTGYTQTAWNTDPSGTGGTSYSLSGSYTGNADVTLYPTWTANSYTISYYDGGATDNITFSGEHMPSKPTSHTYGTATTLKKASKSGYVFEGWYTEYGLENNTNLSIGATAITANQKLYAKWTAMNLTPLANGTLYTASDMVPDGIEVTSTTQYWPGVSTNNIFNLLGTGSGTSGSDGTSMGSGICTTKTIDGTDFTKALYFKTTSSLDGSSMPTTRTIQFKISGEGLLDIYCYKPTKIYLIKSGGSAVQLDASDTDEAKITKAVSAGTYYLYGTEDGTANKLYGMKFTPKYTVTYNLNGGQYDGSSDAPTQVAVTSGTEITMPSMTPTKDGYAFLGWRSSANSTDYAPGASYTMTAANTTFTAQWQHYANSIDIENFIKDGPTNDQKSSFLTNNYYLHTAFTKTAYEYNSTSGKEGYRGLKMKDSGFTLTFYVPSGKDVTFGFGRISANSTNPNITIKMNNVAQDQPDWTLDSDASYKQEVTYSTSGVTKFELQTTNSSTTTLMYVMIETPSTTYTLTATAKTNMEGAFSGSETITNSPVSSVASGTTIATSSNTFTVGSTTVTAPETIAGTVKVDDGGTPYNAPCTWRFSKWNNIVTPVAGDESDIEAEYVPTFAINYELNGGTINEDYPTYYIFTDNEEDEISLPTNVTKANYTFDHWVDAWSNTRSKITCDYWGDFNLTAIWTAKTSPGSGTVSGTTSICSGDNTDITLSASVSGASYQLYKGEDKVGDAKAGTGSALTWSVSEIGTYTVKAVETATHASGDMSGSAVISASTATSISTQPTTAVAAEEGENFTLGTSMVATGQGDLSYQWYSYTTSGGAGEASIGSATSATYTTSKADAGTYYYKVEVTATCGSVKSNMITVTVSEPPCFRATNLVKNSNWFDIAADDVLDAANVKGTITGGAIVNSGSKSLGSNSNTNGGLVIDGKTKQITVYLNSCLAEGTVITLGASVSDKAESGSSITSGLKVSDNACTPATYASESAYATFTQSYTIPAASPLIGMSSFTIALAPSAGKTYLKSISVSNCGSCTDITPSLSYSATTLYADGGTPRQARPTLTGNTGNGDITWVSSNSSAVSVNSSGVITAVGAGMAKISAIIDAKSSYCGGVSTSSTITVPSLVQQTINLNSAWSTVPNMTFPGDPTETLTKNANIAATGYSIDESNNKSGLSSLITGIPSSTSKNDSYYMSLKFNTPSYPVRLSGVTVKIRPIDKTASAIVTVSDGTTTVTSNEVADMKAGSTKGCNFAITPTVFAAGSTITVKIFVYDQSEDKGFRLGSPILVNGAVLKDQKFTDANSTGLWSDPANWDGGSLPEIYHDVVLEKAVTVDIAHATAKSIVIYNDGDTKTGKLTIQPNKGLEVDGTIQKTTDGSTKTATGEADLVLESSSAGNASLIFNNSNSCQATVQMYSKAGIDGSTWNWQYVGTPFTGSIPLYNYYGSWMYKWDNGGWAVVKGGDELDPFVGYCLTQESATTHVMGGTLVSTTDDVEVTMAASTDMVLANSWTAPISIASFDIEGGDATFTSTPATIYLFNTGMGVDDGNGIYKAKDEGTEAGTYVTVPINSAPYTGNGLIAPMQGFFVTTNGDDGAAGEITMNYNDLVRPSGEHTDIVAGPMKAPKRIEERPEVMKIRAEGSVYNDRVVILSREDFSQGFDNGWDGKKMSFGNASPSVYVINEEGGYDAVSAIPEYEGTVVGFRAGTDSEYTIRFEYDGEEMLYLNDLQEQEATPIDSMRTYTFTAEAGDNEARFIISATPVQKVTTGVDPASGGQDAKVRKVIINDHIYIIRGGRMYSVDGALVK